MEPKPKHSGGGPRWPGHTRVSSKNQVTLPRDAMRRAGFRAGDVLRAEVFGPGQLLLMQAGDPVRRLAGSMTSVFEAGELQRLRDEWG